MEIAVRAIANDIFNQQPVVLDLGGMLSSVR
jgi:hypothetical protein